MNRLKPTLRLLTVLVPLLGTLPVAAAAPEQYTLGAQVAPVKAAPVAKPATKPSVKAAPAVKRASKVAAKTKARKSSDVIATDVPPAKLDLSLPKDMVNQLAPPGKEGPGRPVAALAAPTTTAPAEGKPLLPSLFQPKVAEPFELNGRLLTNEMDLQLRNKNEREVEGAALDFKFKQ